MSERERLTVEQVAALDVAVLDRAAVAITEMGWVQGEEICATGQVCAVGAVRVGLGLEIRDEDQSGKTYPYFAPVGFRDRPTVGHYDPEDWASYEAKVKKRVAWHTEVNQIVKDMGYHEYTRLLDEVVRDRGITWTDEDGDSHPYEDVIDLNDGNDGSPELIIGILNEAITRIVAAQSLAAENQEPAHV